MEDLQILNFSGVDCYEKDGVAFLKLENVARGLGFVQEKNGIEYVRWETVQNYLSDLGFPKKLGKDDFIPENIFYRLAMKAKNETAEKFQAKVADEIIPSIRKHGAYMTEHTIEKALANHDFLIQLATQLKEEKKKVAEKDKEILELSSVIDEMTPKVNYLDLILQSKSTVTTTQIAQDYGLSAKKFNEKLHEMRIQHKVNKQWILYADYQGKGYVHSKTIEITRKDGTKDVIMNTEWTQAGRIFLYNELKNAGVYPLIEKGEQP